MNDFIPLATAVALMWKIVDFAKHVRVKDTNSIVTQLATWGAGVLVTFLLAWSDYGDKVPVAGHTLDKLNGASLILFGLSLGATASVGYDLKRALDVNDSAAMPSLVTGDVPLAPPPMIDSDQTNESDAASGPEPLLGVVQQQQASAPNTNPGGYTSSYTVSTPSWPTGSTPPAPTDQVAPPVPAKKTVAKKTVAKKTTAKKTTPPQK